MMILVVGATGSLGGRITRGLLQQGQAVRFLARHNPISEELAKLGRANTAQALIEAGAQAVPGDLKDRASLEVTVKGVDTIVCTATASQRGGEDTIASVDLQGTLSLIEVAKAAGVQRFVYTSAVGSAEGHPVPLFNAKGVCTAALERSGMAYTILVPSVFMEIWIGMVVGIPLMAQQPVTLIGQGNHCHNLISELDVAAFALAAWNHPQAVKRCLEMGGPASYTWTEIVAAVGKALGTQLPVQYLPPGPQVPLLPAEVSGLLNAMETFETFVDMSKTAPEFGIKLTTLDEYIQRTFVQRSN